MNGLTSLLVLSMSKDAPVDGGNTPPTGTLYL